MKRPIFRSIRSRQPNGFTLMEVMITLVIFVLLTAAVYAILAGILQGTSVLQYNQNHKDQIVALNAFLKKKLGGMNAQSDFFSYRRDGEGLSQNGIIFGQNEVLLAIDAKVQANGYYTLRLASQVGLPSSGPFTSQIFGQRVSSDDPSIVWTPLMRDVQHIDWKFQDPTTSQWVDQWINAPHKPAMVEFTLQQAGDLQSNTKDFWLPPITPPPAFTLSP
jgi:prepilin-type N-terminal cleavage/methylation domain-containing protein